MVDTYLLLKTPNSRPNRTSLGTVSAVTPIWLTIVVAVLSVSGALAAQWLAGSRAYRLAVIERDFRREDRDRQNREDAFAKFLVAARAVPPIMAAADEAAAESALAALRDAAAYIELNASDVADGPLGAVLQAAQRLRAVVPANSHPVPLVQEARREYLDALSALRNRLRDDLRAVRPDDRPQPG